MDFRRLEHATRTDAAYFVTFRLAGSLPVTRVTDRWTADGPKYIAFDRFLDAAPTGPKWLARPDVARIVTSVILDGARSSDYELGAWVLMPNHVHVTLRPLGSRDLASVIRAIKGRSAREANSLLHRSGSTFWAKDYFDRRIRDRAHAARVARYTENNPVKAGLCDSAEAWPWSSASGK